MAADDSWFETQYNARAAVPDFPEVFARSAERARRARMQLPCYLDVAYGDGALESMDIFPSAGRSRGLLSFIHGGYWRSRDKADFSFIAPAYCAAGYTVAIPNYALCPQVTIEHIVRQMLRAHAWLYRNAARYGAADVPLLVCGHSAGGHLAAMMAACEWHRYEPGLPADMVRAAFPVSGIYDLMPLRRTSMNADLGLDENAARVASPVTYTPSRAVPVVCAVGVDESGEFRRQCQLLRDCWPHCVRQAQIVPAVNHFTIVESLAERGSLLFDTVEQLMQAA